MAQLDGERRAELVGSLGAVRARIANACIAVGRDPRAVTLIAVTKSYPAGDVATLAALGVLDIGENRDQEASAKVAEVAELRRTAAAHAPTPELRWHFVGRLQSRKARSVATYAHAVHSVDRPELVEQLAAGVTRAGRDRLDVFIQVSLDGDPARGGVLGDDVAALADAVAGPITAAPARRHGGRADDRRPAGRASPIWPRSRRGCARPIRRRSRSRPA